MKDNWMTIVMGVIVAASLTWFVIENLDYNQPCYIQDEELQFVNDTTEHHKAFAVSEICKNKKDELD